VGEGASIDSPHLTDELLIKADQLWQQAEGLVAAEPEVLQRVKIARLSVDFAILERGRIQAVRKLAANACYTALVKARFAPFFATLQQSKVTGLREGDVLNKETYRSGLANDLKIKL
jgi:hypothetical protein